MPTEPSESKPLQQSWELFLRYAGEGPAKVSPDTLEMYRRYFFLGADMAVSIIMESPSALRLGVSPGQDAQWHARKLAQFDAVAKELVQFRQESGLQGMLDGAASEGAER